MESWAEACNPVSKKLLEHASTKGIIAGLTVGCEKPFSPEVRPQCEVGHWFITRRPQEKEHNCKHQEHQQDLKYSRGTAVVFLRVLHHVRMQQIEQLNDVGLHDSLSMIARSKHQRGRGRMMLIV